MSEDDTSYNDHSAHKFWSIYVDEATKHDANLTETWKADMDSTLIFAGLFSATVTAFIIESYKLLKPDPGDITAALLSRMLSVQLAQVSNTSVHAINFTPDMPNDTFVRSAWAVSINVLWFLSLAFSLTAALVVTLVQQWIRDYLQRVQRHNQPQRRGRVRRFLFAGIEKWKLETVVEYIPTLLHLSLFLFFSGLCVFLLHVDQVVAWFVLCVFVCGLAAYAFVTFAPLFDPSSPYETPLSFTVQYIHHFINSRHFTDMHMDSPVQLKMRREQEATSSTLIGDRHALLWAYERITDDGELELFVESIPGLLASANGQNTWWMTFGSSCDFAVEICIARFLKTILQSEHMDPESKRKKINVCLDALFAIFCSEGHLVRKIRMTCDVDEQAYNRFHHLISSMVKEINSVDWDGDNSLVIKANGILVLSHRPPNVEKDFLATPADSRHDMSLAADKALLELTQMRCKLEESIQGLQTSQQRADPAQDISVDNVREALRTFITTLNNSSCILTQWMTIMGGTIQKNQWLSLLEWYTQLPLPKPSQTLIPLPVLDNQQLYLPGVPQLDLYATWILAAMRRVHIYPDLPHFADDQSSSLDDDISFGDDQSRPLKRATLQDHLLRELQPMLMALRMLPESRGPALARDITKCAIHLAGDKEKSYVILPGSRHHRPGFFLPMGRQYEDRLTPEIYAAVVQRPFVMFTSIVSDGLEGSRTLSLLALFSTLRWSKMTTPPQKSDIVQKILSLLYPAPCPTNQHFGKLESALHTTSSSTPCVVRESTVFFYSVFSDILAWERELCSQDKTCLLSSEIQRLNKDILYVTLQGRPTDLGIAEEMLRGTGSRLPDRNIGKMWDVRLGAAAICKRIRIQRSSIAQKRSATLP